MGFGECEMYLSIPEYGYSGGGRLLLARNLSFHSVRGISENISSENILLLVSSRYWVCCTCGRQKEYLNVQ